MLLKFFSAVKVTTISALALSGLAHAEELKPFQPFEISNTKSFTAIESGFSQNNPFAQNSFVLGQTGFDLWARQDKGYHFSTNANGMFGEELIMGMKFADWLSLRVNVIDENRTAYGLFSNRSAQRYGHAEDDLFGYQFGVSSVLNITNNWRLGIDLGVGRVGGELLGLYQDQLATTRLGFGIRK